MHLEALRVAFSLAFAPPLYRTICLAIPFLAALGVNDRIAHAPNCTLRHITTNQTINP